MRKVAILALAVALVAAGAAQAGKPTKSTNVSANAFWYTTEWLSQTSYRSTVWYVGVYQDSGETFSDFYFDSSICEVTPPEDECTFEASRYGFSDLTNDTFTIDAKDLTTAHLDAVYDLQDYDADFNPVGDPVATHIVYGLDRGRSALSREELVQRPHALWRRSVHVERREPLGGGDRVDRRHRSRRDVRRVPRHGHLADLRADLLGGAGPAGRADEDGPPSRNPRSSRGA
jgi:hypothetical protein